MEIDMDNTTIKRKALLFIGSPKGLKSTSYALGSYLLKKHEAVAAADLIVFSFPLYVDQLPAPLLKALELVADHRKVNAPAKPQKIMAIVQCGFPETYQNQLACDIMRQFAKEDGV
jgi:putative NADPH-quinone reductase